MNPIKKPSLMSTLFVAGAASIASLIYYGKSQSAEQDAAAKKEQQKEVAKQFRIDRDQTLTGATFYDGYLQLDSARNASGQIVPKAYSEFARTIHTLCPSCEVRTEQDIFDTDRSLDVRTADGTIWTREFTQSDNDLRKMTSLRHGNRY